MGPKQSSLSSYLQGVNGCEGAQADAERGGREGADAQDTDGHLENGGQNEAHTSRVEACADVRGSVISEMKDSPKHMISAYTWSAADRAFRCSSLLKLEGG